MTKCPFCDTPLVKERQEIKKGIYAKVEVCPKCKDEWIDETEYERMRKLFKRKAFDISGSIAVRLPKEIVNIVGIKDGTEVSFSVAGDKIVISKA